MENRIERITIENNDKREKSQELYEKEWMRKENEEMTNWIY